MSVMDMVEKNIPEKWDNMQNYVELTENQILKKIKKDLAPIQKNLSEKKITIDEAKSELKKINERLQSTKLEKKDKKELWQAFDKLLKLERNIDENTLKNEVDEIVNLLETLTKKDLANLKHDVVKYWNSNLTWIDNRPEDIQDWIVESSENLDLTINNAAEDKNPIARKIWERMQYLIS